MFPIYHLVASIVPIIILFPIYKYLSLLFLVGNYLIDGDHYLWYIIRYKDINFRNAYKESLLRKQGRLHILHTVEFWFLLWILSSYSIFLFIIFMGMVFHMSLDIIDLKIKRCFKARYFSVIKYIMDNI